jgi:N-methylhydantoinase A
VAAIAHVDALGLLKVGPESAGSNPGPACYGRGGTKATVTDADLVLGLIDAGNFLGGDMQLDKAATDHAMQSLGDSLGTTGVQAARGIYRVVTEAMASAARSHATDRGVDYRGLPLFAFGGAGPLHACGVAELLQSSSVIVPPRSSVLSAFGTLVTPLRLDLVRSDLVRLDDIDWERVEAVIGELEKEGRAALLEAGCALSDIEIHVGADMRYFGQQHEVPVTFDADPRITRDTAALSQLFAEAYRTLYGVNPNHVPVEIVSWRITVNGPAIRFHAASQPSSAPGKPKTHRPVHAWQDNEMVPVFDRKDLAVGQEVQGPLIIEERETTTAIPPNWVATIDHIGCIVATRLPSVN